MKAPEQSESTWFEANCLWLNACLARLRELVEAAAEPPTEPEPARFGTALTEESPPALLQLARLFGLSAFERDLLLLAAGPELDPGLGTLCAAAQGDPERPFPTFALALARLPGAHWDALAPGALLRRWRLLEILPGSGLTASPLRVEERVLHFLQGLDVPDDRLAGMTSALMPSGILVASHQRQAERLAGMWRRVAGEAPVAMLCGADQAGKRAVAAAACASLGLGVQVLPAGMLPATPGELDGLARLLGREAILSRRAVLLDCDSLPAAEAGVGSGSRFDAVAHFAETLHGPLLVAVPERRRLGARLLLPLDIGRPEAAEQAALWRSMLEPSAGLASPGKVNSEDAAPPSAAIAALTAQFDLGADAIRAAGAEALERAASEPLEVALWAACRTHARPELESLAKRLRPQVGWDDLVLPDAERQVLEEIATHVRFRALVHDQWGFAERSSRGLGIAALFAGPSGTGKTMAAEVLARELELDLYRVDLAAVVSKYIGETEKNLKRIFDAAETGGAILLFDEADALFGKRTEVKDSHDRYANIEVSYLLQRVESYRGLAILTTNLKDALDAAFLRRLRFVVRFPFPGAALRTEIWRRVFPPETPTEDLDFPRLGRLGLAGGHIKSIAISAAFRAAEEGASVAMRHVLAAARSEHTKLDKPFTEKGMEVS